MTEQMLRDIETQIDGTVPYYVPTLIAEVRRLQQGRERIARVEAIEQGNSLAQRLIEQRDAAIAEARNALHLMAAWGCRDVLAHEEETCALCRAEHALEEALAERDALLVQVDQWRQMADREVTACVEMRAERDEARAALDGWVKWASSSRCIYCGQEFVHDPHDQESADEPKKAHILTCAKHPMAQAQAALTEARLVLGRIEWVRIGGKMQPYCPFCWEQAKDGHTADCALAALLAQEEPHG